MQAELYIRRLLLALVALILIIAGLGGNIGSMLAAVIDTEHLQEGQAFDAQSQNVLGVVV